MSVRRKLRPSSNLVANEITALKFQILFCAVIVWKIKEGGKFCRTCVQSFSFNWVYNDIAYLVAYFNVLKIRKTIIKAQTIVFQLYLPVFKSIVFSIWIWIVLIYSDLNLFELFQKIFWHFTVRNTCSRSVNFRSTHSTRVGH